MPQKDTYDIRQAIADRDRGLSLASLARPRILQLARHLARRRARSRPARRLTADAVLFELQHFGISAAALGPSAGAIFKSSEWTFTGLWRRSTRTSNHGRYIRVWELKD